MAAVGLILFDLDGTLVDHAGAARSAVGSWLEHLGVAPTEDLIAAWFDAEGRHVAAWQRGELDWQAQRRARVREICILIDRSAGDDTSADQLFGEYWARYKASWRAFPDAGPALSGVHARGLEAAVLTNGADEQQRAKIAAVGLADLVGPVFSCDAIGYAKPDIRAYQHVCGELGWTPAEVLHVGDRHDLDVRAARVAGLQAVHLDRTSAGPLSEQSRIASLSELDLHIPT